MHVVLRAVDEQSFDSEVLGATEPVLVDFTATWCPPCKALAPILQQLAVTEAGRLKIVTVDADEHPALAARFGVRGFPTVVVFARGKEVGRQLGLTTAGKLLAILSRTSS